MEPSETQSATPVQNLVVIADDDPVSLEMLQVLLEAQGYTVFAASDGEEAWKLIQETHAPIVISDWEMPRLSGIELARRVRNEQLGGYTYFVLQTSREEPSDIVASMFAGADDFLRKPLDPTELLARLRVGERVVTYGSRDLMLLSLAKLAESRDPNLGSHIERMQAYVGILAEQLRDAGPHAAEVDGYFIGTLLSATPLHDIGKIAIPDSVLLKPESLNDAEFELMKTHASIGGDTIGAVLAQYPNVYFLQIAHDIALSHHERFDGTGYPNGLAGTDIPLAARILALADVYDAITSSRVYRAADSHQVAIGVINAERGAHLDPAVVDAFLARANDFAAISAHAR